MTNLILHTFLCPQSFYDQLYKYNYSLELCKIFRVFIDNIIEEISKLFVR